MFQRCAMLACVLKSSMTEHMHQVMAERASLGFEQLSGLNPCTGAEIYLLKVAGVHNSTKP